MLIAGALQQAFGSKTGSRPLKGAKRLHDQKQRKDIHEIDDQDPRCPGMAGAARQTRAGRRRQKSSQKKLSEKEEARSGGALSQHGWDSLHVPRVNVLRFDEDGNLQKYGSSLYWTQVNVSFMPTENDIITLGGWMAFGIGKTKYKEFDATVNYVHTFGDLAVGMGYTFYYYLNSVLYQNELNWTVAYTFNLPAGITLVPSVIYYLNVGPDFDDFERGTGAVETASSYLVARLDAGIPIYKDHHLPCAVVRLWDKFDFNAKTADNEQRICVYYRR